jgi:two-component system osmolarity sensor histidine kinase EnvZ
MTLFGRSFLLIALLIVASAAATFQIYRVYEREPRARELAQQTISSINLVRAALVSADPLLRRSLLVELNEREGIRVLPAGREERLDPLPRERLFELVATRVRAVLGERTRFAFARDGAEGFWVSFPIDEDEYWMMLPRERLEPGFGLAWLGWGVALLALALAGAWLIASRIARPLASLTRAAASVGRGQTPEALPERGPQELRTLAAAFNRMAGDLAAMERERAMVLAGISHDLRTPLSRLRLALEMSGAERDTAAGMGADIDEMDKVIGQFLDFARGDGEARKEGDLEALLVEVVESYRRRRKDVSFEPSGPVRHAFAPLALRRAVCNLVDNALNHAAEPVRLSLRRAGKGVTIEVMDRGPGIPDGQAERLKRPFTRLDEARSGQGSAGLGLAIVERVARAHGGRLELAARAGGGLLARICLAEDGARESNRAAAVAPRG